MSTGSTGEWYDARYRAHDEMEARISEELIDLAHRWEAPPVRVRCPGGHVIGKIKLITDNNWHPTIEVVRAKRSGLSAAEPHTRGGAGEDNPGHWRMRAKCPHPECPFDGRTTTEKLIKLYVVAWTMNQRTITLRS